MAKRGNPKWQPGVSGNPGGRSSELAAQQSAAKLKAAGLADEALDFLVETLRNKEEATPYRLRAARRRGALSSSVRGKRRLPWLRRSKTFGLAR
jgi:hypothetical protein